MSYNLHPSSQREQMPSFIPCWRCLDQLARADAPNVTKYLLTLGSPNYDKDSDEILDFGRSDYYNDYNNDYYDTKK